MRLIRPWSTVLTTIETISFTVGQNISGSNVLTSRTKSFKMGQKVSETFCPRIKTFSPTDKIYVGQKFA